MQFFCSSLLTPQLLSAASDEDLNIKVGQFLTEYKEDVTHEFPSQIQSFKLAPQDDIKSKT